MVHEAKHDSEGESRAAIDTERLRALRDDLVWKHAGEDVGVGMELEGRRLINQDRDNLGAQVTEQCLCQRIRSLAVYVDHLPVWNGVIAFAVEVELSIF